ncbi:TPA: hypothetical protein EYP12_08425 [Candidatus Bipolaricaulota bacterium]|nr:hypothetical protein [Candidatus Bipolaricaulota bacterium]
MGRYRFDPAASVLVVFATIQGRQPAQRRRLKVALDTGATYTMIPWEVAQALGYHPERSRRRIELMTASGMVVVPLLEVKEVKALGQTVKGLEVLVHDLPPAGRVEGLLGLNFLRGFKLTLDFKAGILELE